MNTKDVRTALVIWQRELDTTIETPWTEECGVQSIGSNDGVSSQVEEPVLHEALTGSWP